MKLTDLKPDKGARKRKNRVGRGISAGQGKTAGRGTKGQGARRGGGKGPYFEGGQLPLVRRLPFKRGFTNIFRVEHQVVNLDTLVENFPNGGTISPSILQEKGIIREAHEPVVILGRGGDDLSVKFDVHTHRVSKSAQEKIEKAGGSITKLEYLFEGAAATVRRPSKEVVEARIAELDAEQGNS